MTEFHIAIRFKGKMYNINISNTGLAKLICFREPSNKIREDVNGIYNYSVVTIY